jgi:hypothetical protein
MVNFAGFGALFGKAAAPTAGKLAQPASKGLQAAPKSTVLAKPSNEAIQQVVKTPALAKKVAIGATALGGIALLSSGALGSGCETLMGANNCQFITSPEAAVSRLTGLPAQLAEGVVFLTAGAFVIGTTYLAHSVVGNGWLTAGTFTASSFIAIGIVNSED